MLQFLDNVNYMLPQQDRLEYDLEQLRYSINSNSEQVKELYALIRNQIYRQIKIEQLAVTIVLNDLHELRKVKPKTADLIEYYVANNTASYRQIAEQFGCTKQNVHMIIKNYSKNYPWLYNLMKIKGQMDSKNENNRTLFFDIDSESKESDIEQLELF